MWKTALTLTWNGWKIYLASCMEFSKLLDSLTEKENSEKKDA